MFARPVAEQILVMPCGRCLTFRADQRYAFGEVRYFPFGSIVAFECQCEAGRSAYLQRVVDPSEVSAIGNRPVGITIASDEFLDSLIDVDSARRLGSHQRYGSPAPRIGKLCDRVLLDFPAVKIRVREAVRTNAQFRFQGVATAI